MCQILQRVWFLRSPLAVLAIILAAVAASRSSADVIYVDADAAPGGNGASWATAFKDLQDGLAAATSGDELWVAEGTYKPDRNTGGRDASFQLKTGVALYGGFAGTEALRSERNFTTRLTILSGNIGNAGIATDNSRHVVNASGVTNTARLDGFIVRDGYASVSGWPGESGGGLLVFGTGNPRIANTTFTQNFATGIGGGAFIESGEATFLACTFDANQAGDVGAGIGALFGRVIAEDCTFRANSSDWGGAVSLFGRNGSTFTRCTFTENVGLVFGGAIMAAEARFTVQDSVFAANQCSGGQGGSIRAIDGSHFTITNCQFTGNSASAGAAISAFESNPTISGSTFLGNATSSGGAALSFVTDCDGTVTGSTFQENTAGSWGGAINNGIGCDIAYTDCDFIDNDSGGSGGALSVNQETDVSLTNCEFTGNRAQESGGAVYSYEAVITDCLFDSNTATTGAGGGTVHVRGDLGRVLRCTYRNNTAVRGGGAVSYTNAQFADSTFEDNTATFGGAMLFDDWPNNTIVARCVFLDNVATNGGAFFTSNRATPSIHNCLVLGNRASSGHGGGVACTTQGSPAFANTLFSGNFAGGNGGAVRIANTTSVRLDCCILTGNRAVGGGGGVSSLTAPATIQNSILYGNDDTGSNVENEELNNEGGATFLVSESCVEGWSGQYGGVGNIDDDPLFADADGFDDTFGTIDDNAHPLPNSPVLNAGDNNLLPPDVADLDADGNRTEWIPVDLDDETRIFDGGADIGAYESTQSTGGPGYFVGPKGGSWFVPTHWQGGTIPDETVEVFLPIPAVIDQAGAIAAKVTILDGGGLTLQATGTLTTPLITVFDGAFLRLDDAAAEVESVDLIMQGAAVLDWRAGTLRIDGGSLTHPGLVEIGTAGPATLLLLNDADVDAAGLLAHSASALRGNGSVSCTAGIRGTLAPGTSPGTVVIDGDLTLDSSSVLEMELEDYSIDSAHDLLVVTGQVSLDGTFRVLVAESSGPNIVSHTVVTATSFAGAFDTIDQPDPPGGFIAAFAQSDDEIRIGVTVPGPRVYVQATAPNGGDGQSWATAFDNLEDALFAHRMNAAAIDEVWVAEGVYVPVDRTDADDPRSASFQLASGLVVYGGFEGTETELGQRDPEAHPTDLTGDVLDDDLPGFENRGDNVFHVVLIADTDDTAVLDGFRISGGYADDDSFRWNGGGVYVDEANPIIRGCIIQDCYAPDFGGGIFCFRSNGVLIEDCRFLGNAVETCFGSCDGRGGGFALRDGTATLSNCWFENNEAVFGGGASIGVHDSSDESATFLDCEFVNNRALNSGACLSLSDTGTLIMDGCTLRDNGHIGEFDPSSGAGIRVGANTVVEVSNSVFRNLRAHGEAAIHADEDQSTTTLIDSLFEDNAAMTTWGGAAGLQGRGTHLVLGCTFIHNTAPKYGGAVATYDATFDCNATFIDCQFIENSVGDGDTIGHGGAVGVPFGAGNNRGPTFVDCQFEGNTANGLGGAIYNTMARLTLDGTTFEGDSSSDGSAVYNRGRLRGNGSFAGAGTLENALWCNPGFGPGDRFGRFTMEDGFRQVVESIAPILTIEIGGTIPGDEFDVIDASAGVVDIQGGGLRVDFVNGFTPQFGQQFDVIQSQSLAGAFDVVGVSGLPQGLYLEIDSSSSGISLVVQELDVNFGFVDADSTDLPGSPSDAVLGDFDGDGDLDVALAMREADSVVVLRNAGLDGQNNWLGFTEGFTTTTVGSEPAALATGFFNGDSFPDIAVANFNGDSVSILTNDADGDASFTVSQTIAAGNAPTDVAAGSIDGNASVDLAVALSAGNSVRALINDGGGSFSPVASTTSGTGLVGVELADLNGDGDPDLATTTRADFGGTDSPAVGVHVSNGGNGTFGSGAYTPVGEGAFGVVTADLDLDTYPDVVTTNADDGTISVLVNEADGDGSLSPAVDLQCGGDPSSIATIDADLDGDLDLAVTSSDLQDQRVVFLIRNDLQDSQLVFAGASELSTAGEASIVRAGDIDDDTVEDLIAVNVPSGGNPGGASIAGLVNISGTTHEETVLPSSFTRVRGLPVSGGLSDLFGSDDLRLVTRPDVFRTVAVPPVQVEIRGTSPDLTPSELRFTLETRASVNNIMQRVQVFNYDTNLYEQKDARIVQTTDGVVQIAITQQPERYVNQSTGEVRVLVQHIAAAFSIPPTWTAQIDQSVWTVTE